MPLSIKNQFSTPQMKWRAGSSTLVYIKATNQYFIPFLIFIYSTLVYMKATNQYFIACGNATVK
jgi:hypothetical protein